MTSEDRKTSGEGTENEDLDVTEIETLSCNFCGMKVDPSDEVVFAGQKCALCGRGILELKGGD